MSTMDDGQQYNNDEKLQPSVMLETISLTTTTSHHRRVNTTDSRIRMWV